ncbi:hypothetical protein ACFVRD_48480, partial [Streptomyces sp. NPDC057908]|uniref:hypothetical protein n=1 Tax=Streptomyces sp. NPDC057908 TaxID=3346276 RepID=UPI0036EE7B23
GDDHGLTSEQLDELLSEADEIEERYPDADDQRKLMDALGIRDTSAQASTLLTALEIGRPFELSAEQEQMLARAEKRARQVV